ncbi:hypothetical protein ACQJBY_067718 [Aegilops geniculata]
MANFPAKFAGVNLTLLRPEETDNRASTRYDHLIEVEAKNFPLELWHPQGANFVFGHFGVLCCVDQHCLNSGDFTAMRAFVRVESDHVTPDGCILRLPPTQIVDVKLRVIKTWAVFEEVTVPLDGADPDEDGHAPHIHGAWRWNCNHAGPCVGSHASDSMPPPSPRGGSPPPPPGQEVQARGHFLRPFVGGPLLPPAIDIASPEPCLSGDLEEDFHETLSPTIAVSNSFSSLAVDNDDLSQLTANAFSDDHVATRHRMQAAGKRATDTAKLRRSRRLADAAKKDGGMFLDMTTKAVRAKARRFDLLLASADLVEALDDSGLTSDPDVPVLDSSALSQIARLCGAEADDLLEVSSTLP